MTTRIAVLASGSGTNLQALLEHQDRLGDRRHGSVVLVASNRAGAQALDRARSHGAAAEIIANPADGEALRVLLESHGVELVVLAGYLKLVPPEVTRRWGDRVINVHPALLPSFGGAGMYGRRVHEAVLASGARISGATVHLVSNEYDRGRILAQWPVPVLAGDTPETLAARVLSVEHLLLPPLVEIMAAGGAAAAGEVPGPGSPVSNAAFELTALEAPDAASVGNFLDWTFSNPLSRR